MNKEVFEIRCATQNDASDIADLSRQLGYQNSEVVIMERLSAIFTSSDHVVYVASVADGSIIGWVHVYRSQNLQSDAFAEIGGCVVSELFRGKGGGRRLVDTAEKWAMQKNLSKLRVRSNIERDNTRHFYVNMGFSLSKQQRVFDKILHVNE